MLNGVLDYKRFRKTPLPDIPPPINIRGPRGPTGPSGTPFRPQDVFTGPTGITGITGPQGPTGTFVGNPFYENLTPEVQNNTFSFGTPSVPFQNVFINSGRFGSLDLSTNGVFPAVTDSVDLGSETRKFHDVFTKKAIIETNSLAIRDQSGNKILMSFDLENYKIIYDVTTADGNNFKLYSIENIQNTLDVNLFPYTGLTFYNSMFPVYNVIDTVVDEIYTNLQTMDNLELSTTGYYIIMSEDGRIDTPSTVTVSRDSVVYTFNQEIQNLEPGILTLDVSSGDMFIMTVYKQVGLTNTYSIKWSQYSMSYPVDSVSTSYFINGSVTTDKIADNAITSDMISDNTITTEYLAFPVPNSVFPG